MIPIRNSIEKRVCGAIARAWGLVVWGMVVAGLAAGHPLHAQTTESPLLPLHSVSITSTPLDAVAFSPDGAWLAVGGRDHRIRLYDAAHPQQAAAALTLHTERITALAFSPDGALLAASSADGSASVWALATVLADPTPVQVIRAHADVVTSLAFTQPAEGGLLLATGGRDGLIWLGDPHTGAETMRLDQFGSPVWALAFNPDPTAPWGLASAAEDGIIWLWGMGETARLGRLAGHDGPAMQLRFDPSGRVLLSGGMDGTLRVWAVETAAPAETAAAILHGHRAPVTGIVRVDANVVLTASLDGSVRAWDVNARASLDTQAGDGFPLTALAYHAGSAAAVGTQGRLTVWQVADSLAEQLAPQIAPQLAPQVAAAPTRPAPTAAPGEQAAGTSAGGARILIPVANVDSPITVFPIANGTWEIDPWEHAVGYLEGTAWLGQGGNIALGGHSSYPNGQPGIFAGLYNVRVGDVILLRERTREEQYVVTRVHTVRYDEVSVVYPTTDSRLTLITCDLPSLDPATGTYLDRLVVVARLVR